MIFNSVGRNSSPTLEVGDFLLEVVKKFTFHCLYLPAVSTANVTIGADISITTALINSQKLFMPIYRATFRQYACTA